MDPNLTKTFDSTSSAVPIIKDTNDLPLSKKQHKKRLRWEKAQAIKKRRKDQTREIRHLQAKQKGRDLDREREQQQKNEEEGKGWEKREEKWIQIMKEADVENSFRVCFDCSYEDQMTWKETNSLSLQLRYAYAVNRKSTCPVYIDVCSLKKGGDTRAHLENVAGFPDRWVGRAFRCYELGLDEIYDLGQYRTDENNNNTDETSKNRSDNENYESPILSSHCSSSDTADNPKEPKLAPNHRLMYLTGDSPNTLTTLEKNAIYIIGGIVDRNRLKHAALDRATLLGIETARLPLDENFDFKGSTRILTCNHVFEILLQYRKNGYCDWRGAILSVLPGRKDVQEKNNDVQTTLKDTMSTHV